MQRIMQTESYKYQLSLINPRDGIVLWTELDDKLLVDRRR